MKQLWAWIVGALMIAAAIVLALNYRPHRTNELNATRFGGDADRSGSSEIVRSNDGTGHTLQINGPEIVPQNNPVITRFVGDLETKGRLEHDGTFEPFVAGETLRLEAEAHNAVEFRWTCNGEVLKDHGQEWSKQADRIYDTTQPGKYLFAVKVRGVDPAIESQEKKAELTLPALKIMSLEKAIVHDDDERFVTGDEIFLNVSMSTGVGIDLDYYRYRYFVNDSPVKHPDDDEEWTEDDSFHYAFPTPGSYTFKVEARRATEKQPEGVAELPETVIVADAVLLSFDSFPDNAKGVPLGTLVNFSAFPVSRFGKSECRFGVKKINAADFAWQLEEDGSMWGESARNWLPTEPGTYLVRCEVRELGKAVADDYREMYFTVTDGNF